MYVQYDLANLGSAVEKVYDLLEPQIPETTVPRDD
jgi:hypothetical protein